MLHWELLDFHVLDKDYFQKYEVGTRQENTVLSIPYRFSHLFLSIKGKPHLNQEPNHDVAYGKFLYLPLTLLWAGVREAEGQLSVG